MRTKHFLFLALTAIVLFGCYDDDKLWDAVNDQNQRIQALESWQKVVNNNIDALQTLVSGKHYITSVTPITLEGKTVGYTISFNDCDPITIYNGEKGGQGDKGEQGPAGSTPVISIVQQSDGDWYWTLNGELMKDANGNSIRANGKDGENGEPGEDGQPGQDGDPAPVPKLNTGQALISAGVSGTWTPDAIYLSVDEGKTWTQVSGKDGADGSDGDSMFTSIDYTSSKDHVVFTLANGGGDILVPKYKGSSLTLELHRNEKDTPWEIDGFGIISCIITVPDNSTYQLEIISPKGWKVEKITQEGAVMLRVTAPQLVDLSTADYEGKLIVMLNVDNDPSIIRTLDLKLTDRFRLDVTVVTIAELLNNYGYKGTSLTATLGQEMNKADWEALRNNTTIQHLDLSEMMQAQGRGDEFYTMPADALRSNKTLKTIKLPKTLKNIGNGAFYGCEYLQEIEIPENVKHIPSEAFRDCSMLEKVVLPEGLETIGSDSTFIGQGAFRGCEMLTNIIIPSSCKWIGPGAFYMTGRMTSTPTSYPLTISKNVTLTCSAFRRCGMTELELNTDKADTIYAVDGTIQHLDPKQIFMECQRLRKVVIGEGVRHSPGVSEDFKYCTSLETVELPSTFETIHKGMFGECGNLKSIIWRNTDSNKMVIEFYSGNEGYLPIKGEGEPGHASILKASPFVLTNETFKIYVPAGVVQDMKDKYPDLASHIAAISN